MSNRRIGCLGVMLVMLLCVSLFFNLALVLAHNFKAPESKLFDGDEPAGFGEVVVAKGKARDQKIALIAVTGLITSGREGVLRENMVEDLKAALRQATADEAVKAIVLHVESPGGEVTAADAIYRAVCEARAKKPVVVYMGAVAASGGYYIACGGSWLMAADTSITGSIGVIIQTLRYEELFGKIGLETLVFKSGQFKDLLSGSRQMTPEEKEYIQALVMQIYDKFLGVVAAERHLPAAGLRGGVADGRIVSGKDALGLKLIDQTGYLEDAYAKARELAAAPDARVIRYEAPFRLGRFFRMWGRVDPPKVEVDLLRNLAPPLSQLPPLEAGKIYLLPAFFAP